MASLRQRALLDPGSRAPGFRLPRLEGGEATLAELTACGRVLLVFFKVTCPVCQLTMPFLDRLNASGTLSVCGISQNDAADTREFNTYFGVNFSTLLDAEDDGFPGEQRIRHLERSQHVPGGTGRHDFARDRGLEQDGYGGAGRHCGNDPVPPEDNVPVWKAG